MGHKRAIKDFKKVKEDYLTQIGNLRNENGRLRREVKELQEALNKSPEVLAHETPQHRIGCNDCGMRGMVTPTEFKKLSKVICPVCKGNNWKIFK